MENLNRKEISVRILTSMGEKLGNVVDVIGNIVLVDVMNEGIKQFDLKDLELNR